MGKGDKEGDAKSPKEPNAPASDARPPKPPKKEKPAQNEQGANPKPPKEKPNRPDPLATAPSQSQAVDVIGRKEKGRQEPVPMSSSPTSSQASFDMKGAKPGAKPSGSGGKKAGGPRIQFDDPKQKAQAEKRGVRDIVFVIMDRLCIERRRRNRCCCSLTFLSMPSCAGYRYSRFRYEKEKSLHDKIANASRHCIHSSVLQVGIKFADGSIVGGDARCVAMLTAFKEVNIVHVYIYI